MRRFAFSLAAGLIAAASLSGPVRAEERIDPNPPATRPAIPDEPSLDRLDAAPPPPKNATSDRAVQSALPASPGQELDDLFAELAKAPNPMKAHGTEQRILQRLIASGSPSVDLLMSWTDKALSAKDYPAALDLLDQIIALKPDYAEGYNRRATVYYVLDDYTRSVNDIRRVLALEPRHFGALSGLGAILTEIGQPERAREIYMKALAIHPNLKTVKDALKELDESDAGKDI